MAAICQPALLPVLLAALLAGCAGPQPAASGAPAGPGPSDRLEVSPPGDLAEAPNPLLRLQRRSVEGGRAVELLALDLRPDERMVEARLTGPLGRQVIAPAERIRHGRSLTSTDPNPRVSLFGGSNTGVGVTLSLDVFGRRDPPPPPDSTRLRAWTRLPVPPDTSAGDWEAEAVIEDSYGRRQVLRAG